MNIFSTIDEYEIKKIVFLQNPFLEWLDLGILCRMDWVSARDLEYEPVSRPNYFFFDAKFTKATPKQAALGISRQIGKAKKDMQRNLDAFG